MMSFFGFIENLQKKPEAVRKRIVFLSAIAITVIIFIFWLATLSVKNNPSSQDQKKIKDPFESIKEDIIKAYDFFKNAAKRD